MIDLVVARLRANATTLKLVEPAAEYAALKAPPPAARQPAAYVIPQRDTAGRNNVIGAVRQRVGASFGVIIMLGNLRDARGGQAVADIDAVKADVRAALLGWTPQTGWEPVLMGAGSLIDIDQGVLVWMESFSTAYQFRAPA